MAPTPLFHGNPQTNVMWHEAAPRLAVDFTIVATDLRGYGDSSKPETTPDHTPYSKRAMARDQISVMRQLGFEHFNVCGHDRGGPGSLPDGARPPGARAQALLRGQGPRQGA